jgi:HK97 family phage prohead protease
MLRRAYSLLEVKDIEETAEYYTIKGMASTPTPDRMNDIVEPKGAKFAPEIPLLWQHDSKKPVGITEFGKPTSKGIPFTARLPKVAESGALKERIEEAVQSIKYRLVCAVSIGFRVLNGAIEWLDNGGIRFLETEIMELSLVTIPANAEATITSIKTLDAGAPQRNGPVLLIRSPTSREKTSARGGAVKLTPRN